MHTLTNNEMLEINGGGFWTALGVGIITAGVFIASVIYGYINPNSCNK